VLSAFDTFGVGGPDEGFQMGVGFRSSARDRKHAAFEMPQGESCEGALNRVELGWGLTVPLADERTRADHPTRLLLTPYRNRNCVTGWERCFKCCIKQLVKMAPRFTCWSLLHGVPLRSDKASLLTRPSFLCFAERAISFSQSR